MEYKIIPCVDGDAELTEQKLDAVADSIVMPEEGAEDDYVLLKIADEEGNIIAGCIVEIDGWKVACLDTLWVNEKYRRQGLGLEEYNNSRVPYEHDWISLDRKIADEAGDTVAGCFAGVHGWHCAIVEMIWVDEALRKQSVGSRLLHEIEQEAKENGAYIAIAESFDWSLPFFEKNGYTMAAVREDIPKGHCCFVLRKKL